MQNGIFNRWRQPPEFRSNIFDPRHTSKLINQGGIYVAEDRAWRIGSQDHHTLNLSNRVSHKTSQPVGKTQKTHYTQNRNGQAHKCEPRSNRSGKQISPGKGIHLIAVFRDIVVKPLQSWITISVYAFVNQPDFSITNRPAVLGTTG
jgi:hypothetical protein